MKIDQRLRFADVLTHREERVNDPRGYLAKHYGPYGLDEEFLQVADTGVMPDTVSYDGNDWVIAFYIETLEDVARFIENSGFEPNVETLFRSMNYYLVYDAYAIVDEAGEPIS